ncbi:MAG: acylphosphatase [Bdellovibrionaceae bacterium]|nr:acylphosphatase [Pseudobdellovibrionaceae bacterium]
MQFRQYLVAGRVQGVSFRNFTQKRAGALGLTGWVRNLSDGRVEIFASGTDKALLQFEEAIHRGPLLARVDAVELRHLNGQPPLTTPLASFEIRADGEAPWSEEH